MNAIDLFCGAGGFSYGLQKAGINILYGYDNDEDAIKTYNKNHISQGIEYDIREDVPDIKENIDLVFGSPPCKGFSDARGSRYVDDEDNGLVFEFIRWVSEIDPDVVLIENVTGIRTISDNFINGVKKELREKGYYNIQSFILNLEDFSVPQSRERFFILATKSVEIPDDVVDDIESNKFSGTDIEEAIMDLPKKCDDSNTVNTNYNTNSNNDNHNNFNNSFNSKYNTRYSNFVKDSDKTYNHTCKRPDMDDSYVKSIISSIDEGQVYRSNRKGDKYVPVWSVFDDNFTANELETLEIISNNRNKKDYTLSNGYVDPNKLPLNTSELDAMVKDGWLREKDGGYDINTKSGVRPKYRRLDSSDTSGTILTTDFRPREKLHPTYNRGLSLREGARIQSIPDSFEFTGSFTSVSNQIGNAVPPLLAYNLGIYINKLY